MRRMMMMVFRWNLKNKNKKKGKQVFTFNIGSLMFKKGKFVVLK